MTGRWDEARVTVTTWELIILLYRHVLKRSIPLTPQRFAYNHDVLFSNEHYAF